jgi:hypothetical protein
MKGIIFIEPMFRKVVSGEKTQTRRIIVSRTGFFNVISKNGFVKEVWQCDADGWNGENLIPVRPRYRAGEILYLKEPYFFHEKTGALLYKYNLCSSVFSNADTDAKIKWQNKLFMPEKYARHFIEITDVRAERLQDIRNEDCLREGVGFKDVYEKLWSEKPTRKYFDYSFEDYEAWLVDIPVQSYYTLINKINGKGTWESNPFVWVYDFKLIKSK